MNSNCDLKICDFGLARVDFVDKQYKTTSMTDYVATRWYRAPEVILSWEVYTKAIDIWAVGCITAELLGRQPLFPGIDSQNQIQLIIDVLGSPSADDIGKVKQAKAKKFAEPPRGSPTQLSYFYFQVQMN